MDINFNLKYKHKYIDTLWIKLKFCIFIFVLSLVIILIGIFILSFSQYHAIYELEKYGIYLAIYISVFVIIISPIIFIRKNVNRGLSGEMSIKMYFDEEDNKYKYSLNTTKKNEIYTEKGEINLLNKTGKYIELSTLNKGRSYYIPLKLLANDKQTELLNLATEIKNFRTKK